jgi:hypothetical protein
MQARELPALLLPSPRMEAPDLLEVLHARASREPLDEPLLSAIGDVLLGWLAREHAQAPPRLHRETFARLGCMSPEQARGRPLEVRSDVFSMGVLLFQLACGRAPFEGITELVEGDLDAPLAVNRGVSHALAVVLSRALALDPAARFASAAELRAALELAVPPASPDALAAWAERAKQAVPAPAPAPPPADPRPRGPRLAWAGIAALIVVPGAVTLAVLRAHELHELDVEAAYSATLRPCELITIPPGAGFAIDGVAAKERTPTIVRFEPGRTYTVELRSTAGAAIRQLRDQKKLVVRMNDGAVLTSEVYGAQPAPPPRSSKP